MAQKTNSTPKPRKTRTKSALILALLRRKTGASIGEMAKATGWRDHSVRGFLSATVRKKLGLELTSTAAGGKRRYRIGAAS